VGKMIRRRQTAQGNIYYEGVNDGRDRAGRERVLRRSTNERKPSQIGLETRKRRERGAQASGKKEVNWLDTSVGKERTAWAKRGPERPSGGRDQQLARKRRWELRKVLVPT